jgi:hypothetical protein
MVQDKLKPEIRNKRIEPLSKTVLLPHDNAHLHAAAATLETLNLGFCHIDLTAQTSHQATFMPSDRLLLGVRFGSDKKSERNGPYLNSGHNLKRASPMESESLRTDTQSVSSCREAMLKNDAPVTYISIYLWSVTDLVFNF